MPAPSPSPTPSLSSTHSELSTAPPTISFKRKGAARAEPNDEADQYSRNEPLHDLDDDLICGTGNEEVLLREESDSDDYDFTDDDYEMTDLQLAFNLPTKFKASKIVSIISINGLKHFVFLFEDNKIYYVECDIAKEKFKEHVRKFYSQKGLTLNEPIREDL